MHNNVEKAVIHALSYADIFDAPLSFSELHMFIEVAVSRTQLENILKKQKSVQYSNGYWCLRGRAKICAIRKTREKVSGDKLNAIQPEIKKISKIPTVLFIGVTGSIAVQNAVPSDDIDLCIIARANTLWLTRMVVTLILFLSGKKRSPTQVLAPNTICVNLWMSEHDMYFSEKNIFLAREIIHMKKVINKSDMYKRFLVVNTWVYTFFPNALPRTVVLPKKRFSVMSLLFPIDYLCFVLQKWYMGRRKHSTYVSRTRAAFYPQNTADKILAKYKKRVVVSSKIDQKRA